MTETDPALERAKKRVADVRDVFYHLMVYVFVNVILVIVDLRADGGSQVLGLDWAYWPILGWGIGLAGHAISVFFGDDKVRQVYERERAAGE